MEISKTGDWDRVVLGIDPGTNVMGYGVIGIKGEDASHGYYGSAYSW